MSNIALTEPIRGLKMREIKLNRRDFLGGMGFGVAGTLAAGCELISAPNGNIETTPKTQLLEDENKHPLDVKLNVKQVFGAMVHSGMWEGPCRWRKPSTPAQERAQLRNQFVSVLERDKTYLSPDANLLEPLWFEYSEDLEIDQRLSKKLEPDKDHLDLYLINTNVFGQYFSALVGKMCKKPVAMRAPILGHEAAAYLRSRGIEGYVPIGYDQLNNLISILRARKVFQQTNILYITDRGRKLKRPVSSISDFEDLKKRFGIDTRIVTFGELSEQINRVRQSKNIMKKAENLADELIKNAQSCHIDRKYVISDIEFHFAVNNLMKKYNSNAFTIECREFCASRLPDKWKIVPCLSHVLRKDQGHISSCEGDINALLAMKVLTALSKKSAYMGNLRAEGKDVISINHCVPGMKMLGFDKPDLPYQLRNFIVSGWGTKVHIDFEKVKEKEVTIARFNTLATKILATKGQVIGCRGLNEEGCSLFAVINVANAQELANRRADYGFHFAMVYGDYTQQLDKLADLINVEVEWNNV